MAAHGRVFWILGIMQYFWYATDKRRERFVKICEDRERRLVHRAIEARGLPRRRPQVRRQVVRGGAGPATLAAWTSPQS